MRLSLKMGHFLLLGHFFDNSSYMLYDMNSFVKNEHGGKIVTDHNLTSEYLKGLSEEYLSRHYSFFYPAIVFEKADGPYLFDLNGKPYIDCTSGESFLNLGHNNPKIRAAIDKQLDEGLLNVCGCNFMHPSQALLSQILARSMPASFKWKVFFTNSGAESIEGAIKLAQYATKRKRLIAFQGAFHGRTLGALHLTNSNPIQQSGFFLDMPVEYSTWGVPNALLTLQSNPHEVAAVFLETVQGYGGINVPPHGFLAYVREFCDTHNALMIVDEIQAGLGRTGTFWAFEQEGVVPDIVCSAKALGGGLPLGAVIGKREIMDQWEAGSHGSSGGGNPVACAAGIAFLSLLNKDLLKYVRETGLWFMSELQRELSPHIVTGRGLMVGIEFPNTEIREQVMREAANQGLVMLKANRSFHNASIRLIPPLNTPRQVLQDTIDILRSLLKTARV